MIGEVGLRLSDEAHGRSQVVVGEVQADGSIVVPAGRVAAQTITAVELVGPARAEARPADRDDFDCSRYPEGDGHHDYRKTASSYDGTGLDHPDYRDGETCWRCRRCGDVFVALDSEMAAEEEERWWNGA